MKPHHHTPATPPRTPLARWASVALIGCSIALIGQDDCSGGENPGSGTLDSWLYQLPQDEISATVFTTLRMDDGSSLMGISYSASYSPDPELVAVDPGGSLQWRRSLERVQEIFDGVPTADGGALLTGYYNTSATNPGQAWSGNGVAIKLNSAGRPQWQRLYELNDFSPYPLVELYSGVQLADGGFALVGMLGDDLYGFEDLIVVRTDEVGEPVWERLLTADDQLEWNFVGTSVVETQLGELLIAVRQDATDEAYRSTLPFIVRLDAAGVELDRQQVGGRGDRILSLRGTNSGNIIAAGYTYHETRGCSDAWVLNLDATGLPVWSTTAGGPWTDVAHDAYPYSAGGALVAGAMGTPTQSGGWNWTFQDSDAWAFKVDPTGQLGWSQRLQFGGMSAAQAVDASDDVDRLFAGVSLDPPTSETDLDWMLQTDSAGRSIFDSDGDGFVGHEDCGEGDADVHPSAVETCDDRDEDCDGKVDEGGLILAYRDQDGDTYGAPGAMEAQGCTPPSGYVLDGTDCDDTDPAIHPLAKERLADGIDQDCDGQDGAPYWTRAYEAATDEAPFDLAVSPSGEIVVVGTAGSPTGDDEDGLILGLSAEGAPRWKKTLGGAADEDFASLAWLDTGGYLVAGHAGDCASAAWLLRLDARGEVVWNSHFGLGGYTSGRVVIPAPNGEALLAGSINGSANGTSLRRKFVVKVDAEGRDVWSDGLSGDSPVLGVEARAGIITPEGGAIVGGTTSSRSWVARYDAGGAVTWQTPVVSSTGAQGMAPAHDGGAVIVGTYQADYDDDVRTQLVAVDEAGSVRWQRLYGDAGYDSAGVDIAATRDGGYVIAGARHANTPEGRSGIWLFKVDAAGDWVWEQLFARGAGLLAGRAVVETPEGDLIVAAGTTSEGSHNDEVWLIKTDSMGRTDHDFDGDGFTSLEECDDTSAANHPGGEEVCDGEDQDCDGTIDEGASGPGTEETCDGRDQDCDGAIDEGLVFTYFADADGDGYGDPDSSLTAGCQAPPGYVADSTDCLDSEASAFPGAEEVCDDAAPDNDCDGVLEEGCLIWNLAVGSAGSDEGLDVITAEDGAFVVGGGYAAGSLLPGQAWVLKVGPHGDPQWSYVLEDVASRPLAALTPDPSGGFVAVGATTQGGATWPLTLGISEAGQLSWSRSDALGFPGALHDVGIIDAESWVEVGYVIPEPDRTHGVVVKAKGEGQPSWLSALPGAGLSDDRVVYKVAQDRAGGLFVAGIQGPSTEEATEVFVEHRSGAGALLWESAAQLPPSDTRIEALVSLQAGALVLLTRTTGPDGVFQQNDLVRFGEDGAVSGHATLSGGNMLVDLVESVEGGTLVGVGTHLRRGSPLGAIIEGRDLDGGYLWSRVFGSSGDHLNAVARTETGYVLTGSITDEQAGTTDLWLVRTDAQGFAPPETDHLDPGP